MAFNNIIIGSKTFVSIGPGLYQNDIVVFGSPDDLLKIVGGRKATKNAPTTCSVSRQVSKDVVLSASQTERRKISITLQISIPEGFTPDETDTYLGEISEFLDVSRLNRILMGES